MKSKGKKKEELDALKKELEDAKNLFVAQFQGMTVAQDSDLRVKNRDTKSKYRVVKNTLARKAAEGTPAEVRRSADQFVRQLRVSCHGRYPSSDDAPATKRGRLRTHA